VKLGFSIQWSIGYHDGVYMMFLLTYFPWGPVKEQTVGSFAASLRHSKLCDSYRCKLSYYLPSTAICNYAQSAHRNMSMFAWEQEVSKMQ